MEFEMSFEHEMKNEDIDSLARKSRAHFHVPPLPDHSIFTSNDSRILKDFPAPIDRFTVPGPSRMPTPESKPIAQCRDEIPGDLCVLITRFLKKDRESRYPNMELIVRALNQAAAVRSVIKSLVRSRRTEFNANGPPERN